MSVAKNLMKKITNFSRKTAAKAKDWGKYLMVATALAVAPMAAPGCTDPESQQQPSHPIEETGIWAEPYAGGVLQDEEGNLYMEQRMVVAFNEPVDVDFVEVLSDGRVTAQIPQINLFEVEVEDVDVAITKVRTNSQVAEASRNYYFETAWDNDGYSTGQENLDDGMWWSTYIDLSDGLNIIENSDIVLEPVTIAVIDNGFDVSSEDLEVPYLVSSSWDFGSWDSDVDGQDAGFVHGEQVSRFAAARNNGEGINGVAVTSSDDAFSVLPLKVEPDDLFTFVLQNFGRVVMSDDLRVAAALVYAAEQADELNVKVANISRGTLRHKIPIATPYAIEHALSKGVITVTSAGNNNSSACSDTPAAEFQIISVGATSLDGDDEIREPNSNFPLAGACMNISAPGGNVLVFDYEGNPSLGSGTSYAAPQVAGLTAIIKAIRPDADFDEVVSLLTDNADDIPLDDDPNPLVQGQVWKRINVLETVRALIHPGAPAGCRYIGRFNDFSLGESEFAFRNQPEEPYQIMNLETGETEEDPENCSLRQYLGNMIRCDFRIWNSEGTEYEIPDIHVHQGTMGTEVGMRNLTAWGTDLYAEAPFDEYSFDLIRIDLPTGDYSVISDTGQTPHVHTDNLVYGEDGTIILDNGSRYDMSLGHSPRTHGDYIVFRNGNSVMLADVSTPTSPDISEIHSNSDDPIFSFDISEGMVVVGTRSEVLIYDVFSSSMSTFAELGVSTVSLRSQNMVFQTTPGDVYLCVLE